MQNGPTPRSTNKLLADLEQNFELVSTIERLTLENANLRDTIRSLQSKVYARAQRAGIAYLERAQRSQDHQHVALIAFPQVQRAESAAEMLRSEKRAIAEESSSLQDRLTRLEHDFHHVLHHVGHHNIPPATRSERSAAGGPANPTSPTPAMPDISLRDVTRVLAAVVGDDTAKLHAPAVARALSAAGATATETVGASAGENLTGAGHATPSDDDDAGDSIRSPVRQYARQLESTANLREIAEAGSLAQSIAQTLRWGAYASPSLLASLLSGMV